MQPGIIITPEVFFPISEFGFLATVASGLRSWRHLIFHIINPTALALSDENWTELDEDITVFSRAAL